MEVDYEILLPVAIKIVLYSHFCIFWNGNKRVFTYEIRSISTTDNACPFNSLGMLGIGLCLKVVGVISSEYVWRA